MVKKIVKLLLSAIGVTCLSVVCAFVAGAGYLTFKDVQAQHRAEEFCASIPEGMDSGALKKRVEEREPDADLAYFDEHRGARLSWFVMMGRWQCDVSLDEQGKVVKTEVYGLD